MFNAAFAKKPTIGTFDSRAVAVAYYQSQYHQQELNRLLADFNKARESGDTLLAMKLNDKVGLLEMLAKDQGFGKASVNNILDSFTKELDELAKRENLSCIVSKWEIYSIDSSFEIVDITDKVVSIINQDEKVKKYIHQLLKSEPVKDAFFIEN